MAKSKNSVLLLSVMDSWGGGEEVLLKIALHVDDIVFSVATPPGTSAEKFLANRLNVFTLASLKKIYRTNDGWTFFDKLNVLINITKSVFPLYFFMRREKISVIAANGNFAALFALPLVFLFKKKLLVIQHLLYERNSFEGRLLKTLVKYSDMFICVSKSVAENIIEFTGNQTRNKITVIYNGISLPALPEETTNVRVSPSKIYFAVVGSIIREKGHDQIIDAFSQLVSSFPQCKLLVIGEAREEKSSKFFYRSLEVKTENLYLSDKILFKGYVEDKKALYNQFDVLINYSIVPESFSLTVLEALAYNKIVIASNEGGPSEIIEHNANGFLVEPRNKQALFQVMQQVVMKFHDEAMDEVRKNGRATVDKKFSLNSFAEGYQNIFKNYSNKSKQCRAT
ncbi:MAG: glycosyltransferase family 4 protein [Ignavibacteria bacterium]|nr:glycosyltransferase family 4 protein [Ignavibacteria bacterium]